LTPSQKLEPLINIIIQREVKNKLKIALSIKYSKKKNPVLLIFNFNKKIKISTKEDCKINLNLGLKFFFKSEKTPSIRSEKRNAVIKRELLLCSIYGMNVAIVINMYIPPIKGVFLLYLDL
tara:strand:- start:898 stop:1260 length:363 start_codon:yes stop_codon:yes gene_type:complete